MCGICGIIRFDNKIPEEQSLRSMMTAMKHRGPDDEGIFIDNNIGFGFVRLSILDLSSAGNQPMSSLDGRFSIVFNGEIYNYLELREELISHGFSFKTQTDTEVLINSYIFWGEECLNRFNGMWAFAIYDNLEKTIFASRDRFGIKPFYYYKNEEMFVFASDIPPILKILKNRPIANNKVIFDFLLYNRTCHQEETFFLGVRKLQHGHSLKIKNNKINYYRWYDLESAVSKIDIAGKNNFFELLINSIDLSLRSDVPVGACLSGGIDSSTIVSMVLKSEKIKNLHTFSAVYGKGKDGDESEYVNEYTSLVKEMHSVLPTSDSLIRDLDLFIEALVEPVPGTSEYAEFKVMETAKNYCTVLLNGQGVDEMMAGYKYFFGYYFKELLVACRFSKLFHELYFYHQNNPNKVGYLAFLYLLSPGFVRNNLSLKKKALISKDIYYEMFDKKSVITNNLYNCKTLKESFFQHFEYKFEHHLLWADRSGMWFSMETRFPFLDHNLVEYVLSLNNEEIIKDGVNKNVLRGTMKGIVPEKIRTRKDKIGYQTPEDEWFRTQKFRSIIEEIINSKSFYSRGYIDVKRAQKMYKRHLNGKINIGKDIWKWIHLEMWFRKFIDND